MASLRCFAAAFLLAMAAPAGLAQTPSTQAEAAIGLQVQTLDDVYNPISDVRTHRLDVTVTCAVPHLDDPSYRVDFALDGGPDALGVVFDINPVQVTFDQLACLDATQNVRTVSANLTLSLAPTTEAFLQVDVSVTATLARAAAPEEALDTATGDISFRVAYVPGLSVTLPANQGELEDGEVRFNFTASNKANGATRVAGRVTDAPDALAVSLPDAFELARDAEQDGTILVTQQAPCPARFVEVAVEFEGVSPQTPEAGASTKSARLLIECPPTQGNSPAAGTLAALVAVALAVAARRRAA